MLISALYLFSFTIDVISKLQCRFSLALNLPLIVCVCLSVCSGRERCEPAGVLLCAGVAGGPAAGEPPAGGALRQSSGRREGPPGGWGGEAGAVVLTAGLCV